MPGVSVIIPAYNVAPYIAEAVGSVLRQSFPDYEIIVINDGSPDTPELEKALGPFMDRIRYIKQPNKGASAARNAGIHAARAPIVAMLDGDDVWEPHYLEFQLRQFADPEVVLAYGNTLRFGEGVPPNLHFMDTCPSEGEVTYEKIVRFQCNVNASVTARRDVLIRAGMYDENLRTAEDFDLWLRVAKVGGRIVYTRDVLLKARTRPGSLTTHTQWLYEDGITALNKHAARDDLSPSEREAVLYMQRKYRAEYSRLQGKRALAAGDTRTALEKLTEANEFFQTWKLRAVLLVLRLWPAAAVRMYAKQETSGTTALLGGR